MKYELMRAYHCKMRNSFVLDLYNMHYGKGVELRYYLGGNKYDIKSVESVLEQTRVAREHHTIEYWDNLIKVKECEN